jgi:uncharacterized protein
VQQASSAAEPNALQTRVEALEREVAALRSAVQNVCEQLGLSQPGHTP